MSGEPRCESLCSAGGLQCYRTHKILDLTQSVGHGVWSTGIHLSFHGLQHLQHWIRFYLRDILIVNHQHRHRCRRQYYVYGTCVATDAMHMSYRCARLRKYSVVMNWYVHTLNSVDRPSFRYDSSIERNKVEQVLINTYRIEQSLQTIAKPRHFCGYHNYCDTSNGKRK